MASSKQFSVKSFTPDTKRTAFDLTFTNNLSLPIGKHVPCFVKEVVPGQSVEIDTHFAFRLDPMSYPLQNRVRVDIDYFYVRNKNLWKNWKSWIFGNKPNAVPPYLDPSKLDLSIGSLADYMGVPCQSVLNRLHSWISPYVNASDYMRFRLGSNYSSPLPARNIPNTVNITPNSSTTKLAFNNNLPIYFPAYETLKVGDFLYRDTLDSLQSNSVAVAPGGSLSGFTGSANLSYRGYLCERVFEERLTKDTTINFGAMSGAPTGVQLFIFKEKKAENGKRNNLKLVGVSQPLTFTANADLTKYTSQKVGELKYKPAYGFTGNYTAESSVTERPLSYFAYNEDGSMISSYSSTKGLRFMLAYPTGAEGNLQTRAASTGISMGENFFFENVISVETVETLSVKANSPFLSGALHLSALPFRAYESIQNSFYRNTVLDPFVKNGEVTYDEFVTTDEDGMDSTEYKLFNADYSEDFLSTCVPNPQAGLQALTPLEIRTDKRVTQTDAIIKYKVNSDSDVYQTLKVKVGTSGTNQNVVSALSDPNTTYTEDFVTMFNSAINTGITIEDFRSASALQRWAENNQKNGFRYKDQMLAHFGVELSANYCDMAEYIGGRSQDINNQQILSQSYTDKAVLGQAGGYSTCFGDAGSKIYKNCDDYGFIIGIVSVIPFPSYSQLLHRMFTRTTNPADYFHPEFDHLGYQPVTYKEVCPVEAYNEDPKKINQVFGYNRAWSDYLNGYDECHGRFRLSRDAEGYLMKRTFAVAPDLSPEFIHIDQNEINNPFVSRDDSDKVLGQIRFDYIAKLPISKFGVPQITL